MSQLFVKQGLSSGYCYYCGMKRHHVTLIPHCKVFLTLPRNRHTCGRDNFCIREFSVEINKVAIRNNWDQYGKSWKAIQLLQEHKNEKKKRSTSPFFYKDNRLCAAKSKNLQMIYLQILQKPFGSSLANVALISYLWSSFMMFCKSSHKTLFCSVLSLGSCY